MIYACNNRDKCGEMAAQCCHSKPHKPWRCGCCGTWCAQSNGLCLGGYCTGGRRGKTLEEIKAIGITFPIKCVEIEEAPHE